jgi:hypothetical protein
MNSNRRSRQAPQLPIKWAIALVVALIVYAIAQPMLNRQFGWNLPSLNSLSDPNSPSVAKNETDKPQREPDKPSTAASDAPKQEKPSSTLPKQTTPDRPKESTGKSASLSDFLEEVSRDRFRSPAGLIYGPGSEEGHRLKHIQKHLKDQPNRDGKHGVFEADMAQVVRWIDDAYTRASRKAKGTSMRNENGRTVFEATFDQPIGYIGGSEGKRKKNPPSRRLRVVVDEKNVITAFPF